MKKIAIVTVLTAFCLALTYGLAGAVVGGACSNCHTMHNSQNNAPMNWDSNPVPNPTLLRGDCIGCHGQGTANNIEFAGTTPQVVHTNATDLAGGNFAYITGGKPIDASDSGATTSTAGHNVVELGVPETTAAMFPPPGDEHSQVGITAATFTCAGTLGCHGDRTLAGSMAAVRGSHHVNDSVLKFGTINEGGQGGTTALSYRFLNGVHGGEDADWQATVTDSDHNEYKGATGGVESGSPSVPGGNTVSGLCAECHGNFHGEAADIGTGPWLRHPTDIVLPATATKEYQYYNNCAGGGAACMYSPAAPVARAAIPNAVSNQTTPGPATNDCIVMCLSCHKAHATANADILRWNYEDINAGGGASNARCFICHTTKDTGS
ncbi:MAG: cytochrome c3 family protein [Nitrospirota bacterium]